MAKKKRFILLSVVLLVVFVSCGVDGEDGKSYVAYSWVGSLQHIYSEDPGFGSIVYNGTYEETSAGTYYMEYVAWDGSGYWMYYDITVEEGEEAGLFLDGEDGEDLYFDIFLASTGPTITSLSSYSGSGLESQNVITGNSTSEDEEIRSANEAGIETSDSVETNSKSATNIDTADSELLVFEGKNYTLTVRAGAIE